MILQIFNYIFKYINYDDFIINSIRIIGEYNLIFIKIFQWIWINNSQDNNYIRKKIENEIRSYTNNTPFTENDINYKSLLKLHMIANKNNDIFELDNINPINSGTISLVFKGKLNKKDVIIKILRKNIEKKLEEGIEFLIKLEKIFYYIPIINYYLSTKIFEKNKSHIIEQINFIKETENLLLFYNNFKKNKYVIIPNVYNNYTFEDKNIIIMDYIDGKYLYQLESNELNNFFYPFFNFISNSIFIKKIFHCDLHQGNILFYKEKKNNNQKDIFIYKVGIIDYGMITLLNVNEIDFMYFWLRGVFKNKFKEFIDYIKNPNNVSYIFDEYTNINECINFMYDLYENNKLFNDLEKIEIIIDNMYLFLNILKKYNCKISSRYNFFILSFVPILGILVKLGPDIKKKTMINDLLDKICNYNLLD
jgi:predicted unusual protein kinase regulating ubiquinone biosynthesis (AarF/ABC1/UbiB family)